MVEYHPISAKDISRLHHFGPKVLPGILLGYVLYAGGIWKGDTTLNNWRRWTHRQIHARRHNAKEVLMPIKSDKLKFHSQMEQSTSIEAPLQDDPTRDDAEAKNGSWSITGDFIYRHHVEHRVKLIPLTYTTLPGPGRDTFHKIHCIE